MLDLAIALAGLLLLTFVYADMMWTTMGGGSGPLTHRMTSVIWKMLLRLPSRGFLRWGGVIVTVAAVGSWILLLWGGWSIVFSAGEGAVVNATTGQPAGVWERIYFVGFTIFTLGVGDFRPAGALWQVMTPVATLSGLFLVTFAITYLVPVVQAATAKRQLSVLIAGLGLSAQDVVLGTWDGKDCSALGTHLQGFTPNLALLEQRHLTYPILHYFHSDTAIQAIALRVAALDEALTILACGMPEHHGLEASTFRLARQTITEMLETLESAFIDPAETLPPPPSLDLLRAHGLPLVSDATFQEGVSALSARRRLLCAFVEHDGWSWDMIRSEGGLHDPLVPLGKSDGEKSW